ncbi:MAG: hypothetical protein QNK37_27780 [Acidobacteriota bacterium]|nr:hypothetical protein [Acidobacteriota bacterium]
MFQYRKTPGLPLVHFPGRFFARHDLQSMFQLLLLLQQFRHFLRKPDLPGRRSIGSGERLFYFRRIATFFFNQVLPGEIGLNQNIRPWV